MKLRKSCYDPAFCRMGFKRFAPLVILYTLLLVLLTLANVNLGKDMNVTAVYGIYQLFQCSVLLHFGYAFILTALLLGDLYTPRLCFAIHALPVTRGGWFGTQVIQGILSVIPGILLSGGLMAASVTRFRVLIPVWMGLALLQFLFFFGVALLCGICAGNRHFLGKAENLRPADLRNVYSRYQHPPLAPVHNAQPGLQLGNLPLFCLRH